MSSSGDSQIAAQLRPLAEDHEALRSYRRWRLRGWSWGILTFLWLVALVELDGEVALGALVITLVVGSAVEAALRLRYRWDARAAAADFNRVFLMGSERDDAVALLRERCRSGGEAGRAARRLLAALYLPVSRDPVEEPPEPAEPPQEAERPPAKAPALDLSPPSPKGRRSPPPAHAPIPIEVAPDPGAPRTSRQSAPATLPLQPEAARGGEDD